MAARKRTKRLGRPHGPGPEKGHTARQHRAQNQLQDMPTRKRKRKRKK